MKQDETPELKKLLYFDEVRVSVSCRLVFARIADLLFCNQGVVGSNPTAGTSNI